MEEYNDIINMPHHVSTKHPRLSMVQRAAQFAPFAALTGYGDVVNETARLTEERIEINEEAKEKINATLQELKNNILNNKKITVTYFVPDLKKSGGEYITKIEYLKKIDEYKEILILKDNTEIPIKEIIEII
jgi:hypothetical protein